MLARRLPGGLGAPGACAPAMRLSTAGGRRLRSHTRADDHHRLGPLPLSSPGGGAGWACSGPIRGGWGVTWYSPGAGVRSQRTGDPRVGSSAQELLRSLPQTAGLLLTDYPSLALACLLASVSPPELTPSRENVDLPQLGMRVLFHHSGWRGTGVLGRPQNREPALPSGGGLQHRRCEARGPWASHPSFVNLLTLLENGHVPVCLPAPTVGAGGRGLAAGSTNPTQFHKSEPGHLLVSVGWPVPVPPGLQGDGPASSRGKGTQGVAACPPPP